MAKEFAEIKLEAHAQQKRARELNIRCGENLFKVYSQADLEAFVMERLQGARCRREIGDMEALCLPPIEEDLVDLVLQENPEKFRVLEEEMAVSYQQGAPPRVTIIEESAHGRRWLELPDEGIKLPGGRGIEIVLVMGWQTVANNKDIPALKIKVREYLNAQQWSAWRDKPEISLPDPATDVEFPALLQVEYGKCVVTGTPLAAYGAVALKFRSYYDTTWFESRWERSGDEARKVHNAAAAKFAELRVEALKKVQLDEAKKTTAAVQGKIRELYDNSRSYNFDSALRGELYNRAYASSAPVADFEKWQAECEQLIARVEAAFFEVDRKKALEEKRRAAVGETLLGILCEHYALCPICGQEQEWDAERAEEALSARKSSHQFLSVSCECGYGLDGVEQARDMLTGIASGYSGEVASCDGRTGTVFHRTSIGGIPVIDVVVYYKYGHNNMGLVVYPEALIEDGEIVSRNVWHQPTEREMKIAELTRLRQTYEEDVTRAEEEVVSGCARKLEFRRGKNTKTGEEQWQVGSRKTGLIVADRYRTHLAIDPMRSYYCRDVKVIDSWLIIVELYLEVGRNIEAELAELIALEQSAVELELAVAEHEQSKVPEPRGEVTADALEALRAKFAK